MEAKRMDKNGQVTIFIIVAIVIVVAVAVYFALFSGRIVSLSKEMQPVYDYYLSCLEQHTREGIALLGERAGYIYTDDLDFVPGSPYAPFSSQLDFMGQGVPYWMYVSGNNVLKEQVPTKTEMEDQLARYIKETSNDCDFSNFNVQGYDVLMEPDLDNVEVSVDINDQDVSVTVDSDFNLFFEGQSAFVGTHKFDVNTKLGKFYDLALDIYNHEKTNMFLEDYALDVMWLYAPVNGVELSCTPKVFVDEEIREGIYNGLEVNMNSIKFEGDYYSLSNKDNSYFVVDAGPSVDEFVNVMYDAGWPTRIEIYGDRVVEPIGIQEGLSILGFCYVPYHLIYDINFPVMVQFFSLDGEVFQFPMAVVIDNSQPREALPTTSGVSLNSEICDNANKLVDVYTYDSSLNPIEATVQFKCLDEVCNIGETEVESGDAVLSANMPQCVNGFIYATAEGYAETKYQISTNNEDTAHIILSKLYNVGLDLGSVDKAVVYFESENYGQTVVYPDTKEVELVEGYYNVTVYAYAGSSLTLQGSTERVCTDVPVSGVGGLLGLEEEKCYDVNIPSIDVDMAVVGGGSAVDYFAESTLADSTELNINIPLFGNPTSLDELQENYLLVDDSTLELWFE